MERVAVALDLVWVGLCILARKIADGVVLVVSASAEAASAVHDAVRTLAGPPARSARRHVGASARFARRRAPDVTVKGMLASAAVEHRARRTAKRTAYAARPAGRVLADAAGGLAKRLPGLGVAAVVVALVVTQLPRPALDLAAHFVEGDVKAKGFEPLAQRSTVVAANGETIATLHGKFDRQVVPYNRIPKDLVHLVLAAEDKDFWDHHGYDLAGMSRALMADIRAGGVVQGGSTITQQLAKQNFVGDQQSFVRKGKELVYAVALEDEYPKRDLLERYLNQVYFGAGAYGVSAAAQEFFGVPVERLTVAQGALLAGLIHSPSALDPRAHPDAAKARRDEVLRAAARAGLVDKAKVADALRQPLGVQPPPKPLPDSPLVETIKRAFLGNDAFGATRAERVDKLFRGGLTIQTTLDPNLQRAAENIVRTRFPDPNGPTGAVASIDPRSGAIRALFGGTDQRFDLAAQGRRQPGSSFKPFTAVAALENGIPPTVQLPGTGPVTLDYGGPEKWTVDNYEGESMGGSIDMREALVHSVNTAFATLAVQVGTGKIVDVVKRFGFDVERDLGPPSARGPAVALGGLARGVSPLEMASAYGTFATGGVHHEPFLIARVLDSDGHEIYAHKDAATTAISPEIAGQVVSMLQDVVRRGTGTAARLPGWEPFGKTGTTQDSADAWFVGGVPSLATAVWAGHAVGRVPMPRATGGTVVAPLWRDFMTTALAGVAPEPFPFPVAPAVAAPPPSSSSSTPQLSVSSARSAVPNSPKPAGGKRRGH
jgi:penicillin-binding protein 1A